MDPQQLQQLESLCEVLYNSGNEQQRQEAQAQLLSLQSSAEYIPQCQHILDHSQSPYALFVAANALTKIAQQFWNNFTPPQRVELRNYVLGYLASQGPALPDFVATALIQLVCRITKLGWFDDTAHREQLVEEVGGWVSWVCGGVGGRHRKRPTDVFIFKVRALIHAPTH